MLDDVVEARAPSAILRDRVGAYEPRALAGLQVIVCLSEPVDAVILDTDTELSLKPTDVLVAELASHVLGSVKWRIPDDRVGPRPLHP